MKKGSWEEAVRRLRSDPDMAELVRDAYLDRDNLAAARRFEASEEFKETLALLGRAVKSTPPWRVLDVGAGNGIAAYALARAGHRVYALEPDPSDDVGRGAIERLRRSYPDIEILASAAEAVPLPDGSVDAVYVRQALHHAKDLRRLLMECHRVLKPGGCLVAAREHVADDERQLEEFLAAHPLHKWYGGEHAYPLHEYTGRMRDAGFKVIKVMGPYESCINYGPMGTGDFKKTVADRFRPYGLAWLLGFLFASGTLWGLFARLATRLDKGPGRLYSFVALKPGGGKP